MHNDVTKSFIIERSFDGINFSPISQINTKPAHSEIMAYKYDDPLEGIPSRNIYYKIKIIDISGSDKYSSVIKISIITASKNGFAIIPNPVKDVMQLIMSAKVDTKVQLNIFDPMGKMIRTLSMPVLKGNNVITLNDLADKPRGIYQVVVRMGNEIFTHRLLLNR